jgi:hypothetical protein
MKFKSFLFTAFFLFLSVQVFAQRPRYHPQVHEWGIQAYSARFVPQYMDFYPEGTFLTHTPLNGIRYKYHTGLQSAIRSGLFYRAGKYTEPVNSAPNSSSFQDASWRGTAFSLGYERKLHIRKVQLYAGVDGLLSFGQAREQILTSTFGGPNVIDFDDRQSVLGYGVAANAGIRYFFSKHASISIENGGYFLQTNRALRNPAEGTNLPIQLMAESESGWNLFSVYFSYHFKKMKKNCTCGKPPGSRRRR